MDEGGWQLRTRITYRQMKVAFVTREGWTDPTTGQWHPGGTSHLRAVLPAKALAKYGGIETIVAEAFMQDYRTGEVYPVKDPHGACEVYKGYDVIVFIRWMQGKGGQPGGGGDDIATVTQKAQACGQLVVQDVDDWIWGIPTTNAGFYTTHPKVNPHENRDHYKKGLAKADLITVSTPYLEQRLAMLKVPIVTLPNMIDLAAYTPEPVRAKAEWVGWTGSTGYRGGDLEVLRGVLAPWLKTRGLGFIHGGAYPGTPAVHQALRLYEDTPVDIRAACPPEEYPKLFKGIDIFVAPLSDRPFNKAKSACKVMEASAAGIPFIASAVGPYNEYDGGGAVARKPKDWIRHLDRLLDYWERHSQAEAQMHRVKRHDLKWRWQEWRDAYGVAQK